MRVAENPNWAGFYPANDATPTHGAGDRIIDPAGSEKLVAAWGGPSALHSIPGAYHEVLNEPDRGETLAFIVKWVGELLKK